MATSVRALSGIRYKGEPNGSLITIGDAQHFEQVWMRAAAANGPRAVELFAYGDGEAFQANREEALGVARSRRQGCPVTELADGSIRITCSDNAEAVSKAILAEVTNFRAARKAEGRWGVKRTFLNSDLARCSDTVRESPVGVATHAPLVNLKLRPGQTAQPVELISDDGSLVGVALLLGAVELADQPTAAPAAGDAETAALREGVVQLRGEVATLSSVLSGLVELLAGSAVLKLHTEGSEVTEAGDPVGD